VSDEIDRLWALHGLDEKVVARKASLARLPELRKSLETRVTNERTRLESWKKRLGELQKTRRQLEKDIEVATEQERKFQSQLPAVKKNEEYTALLHEISGAKAKRSELETVVLMRMDEEQAAEAERAPIEHELKAAEREMAERLQAIDAEEKTEREQVAALEAERARLIEGLSATIRSRYERVVASRGGIAVVAILKGACGGCFRTQPPQILQDARKRDRLIICDGCGRLLVWPPDSA
jgi:predicted  nucleic acid-binding Zn-ribbon protein